jgi:hypothetical protein
MTAIARGPEVHMAQPKVLLSYARADGAEAAAQLRTELTRAGFSVWRDIEEMRGGKDWKEQIREALRQVDALVLLLTPESVASPIVAWERETALTLEKPVIPVLIKACSVPSEWGRDHYHPMDTPERYRLGFAALIRDLNELPANTAKAAPAPADGPQTVFHIGRADRSAIGPGAKVINHAPEDPDEPAR